MGALSAAFDRQTHVVRGYLWAFGATLSFTLVEAFAKAASRAGIGTLQITFFRCAVGTLVVVPFLVAAGRTALRANWIMGHVVRTIAGYSSMVCSFYAIAHLEFAEAVALGYTRPLFLVVLAVIFLGETVRWRRWAAIAVGFVGVLVTARPGMGTASLATFVAIFGAISVAVVGVIIKQLSTTERPEAVIFYFGIFASIVSLPPAIAVWQPMDPLIFVLLVLIGAVGSLGQYCVIRAYRLVEATSVEPIDYVKLVFATAIGFVFFAEWPDIWVFAGAAIIIASTLYITRREARLAREAARRTGAG